MAFGQAAELILPVDDDRRGKVAGRDPIHRGHDGPKRAGQVAREDERDEDGQERRDRDRQQEQSRKRARRVGHEALHGDEGQTERGQWQDRRRDQGKGESGTERKAATQPFRFGQDGPADESGRVALAEVGFAGRVRPGRAGQRHPRCPADSSSSGTTASPSPVPGAPASPETTRRYPTPRTVMRLAGRFGSGSTLVRSRRIVTQT